MLVEHYCQYLLTDVWFRECRDEITSKLIIVTKYACQLIEGTNYGWLTTAGVHIDSQQNEQDASSVDSVRPPADAGEAGNRQLLEVWIAVYGRNAHDIVLGKYQR